MQGFNFPEKHQIKMVVGILISKKEFLPLHSLLEKSVQKE